MPYRAYCSIYHGPCQRVPSTEPVAGLVTRCAFTLLVTELPHGPTFVGDACALGQYSAPGAGHVGEFAHRHATRSAADDLPSVVATVQGQPISAEELTTVLHGELMRLEMQRYQVLKDKLDDLIADRILSLEAAQRGVSVQQFMQEEIFAKVPRRDP